MSNKEQSLNVRDIVIQFRRKGKKNIAVKNVSLDIYKGEVLGLVGESGSGKTTIGRAIAGVQSIENGSIYLENQIIAGSSINLFKLNKEIYKKIKETEIQINSVLKLFAEVVGIIENKFLNGFTNNNGVHKLKNYIEYLKMKIDFFVVIISKAVNSANKIIINFERINKFMLNINTYIPDIPKDLEDAILIRNNETKSQIIDIKQKLVDCYKYFSQIINLADKNLNSLSKQDFFENDFALKILENLKNISKYFNTLKLGCQNLIAIEKENLILVAPIKKRNHVLKNYYNFVFVRRNLFYDEAIKQLSSATNENEIAELKLILKDFWSKKNLNLTACKKILKLASKQFINFEKINKLLKKLKETNFENILKHYFTNSLLIKKNQITCFWEQLNYILKTIKNNVVKDEKLIQKYLLWNPENLLLTGEEKTKTLKFIEFLELPSIDELVNNSFLIKKLTKKEKRSNRKNTQMIFQDPGSSLNEKMSISEILSEGLNNFKDIYKSKSAKEKFIKDYNQKHDTKLTIKNVKAKDVKNKIILDLIDSVGLLPEHLSRYPHEFSGGQKQRIGIARALSLKPKIIVADEPISALDVSIRSQVLNLFKKFKKEYNLTYLFITHDLSVVKYFADRIAVIYQGKIIELADAEELFINPLHPYTQSLLSAIPIPDPILSKQRVLKVYDAQAEHFDYQIDIPYFREVKPNHFVYANERETAKMQAVIIGKKT